MSGVEDGAALRWAIESSTRDSGTTRTARVSDVVAAAEAMLGSVGWLAMAGLHVHVEPDFRGNARATCTVPGGEVLWDVQLVPR